MPKRKNNCELKRLASELAMRNKRRRGRMQPPLPQCPRPYRYPIPKRVEMSCTVEQEDHFDRLSDDIIVFHILPRLPVRDVVKTSVLSHRWNKFWTEGIPSKLLFVFPKSDSDDGKKNSQLRPILRRGINNILELVDNKQPPLKLDELIIRFNFNPTACHPDVDTWVQIALRNNVTRLALDFQCSARGICYTFPSVAKLSSWHANANANAFGDASVNNVSGLYNLRDVSLKSINVSGEFIECMMSNCPSLERLVLWDTAFEGNVRICTKFSKLKTLEIFQCCFLGTITISSSSLVSFRYDGFEEDLRLEYVPLLSQLSIADSCCQGFFEEGARFNMIYTSQLKMLKLSLDYELMDDITYFALEYPKFKNLKQLEVDLSAHDCSSFLWLINLIMAAPSLQRFSVKLHPQLFNSNRKPDEEEAYRILLRDIEKVRHHPSLKKIEILKFRGTSMEMELAQHLLRISPSLIQCTVTHYYSEIRSSIEEYRRHAKQLNKWLPLSAKLVIL